MSENSNCQPTSHNDECFLEFQSFILASSVSLVGTSGFFGLTLPKECFDIILSHLDFGSLLVLSMTCKFFFGSLHVKNVIDTCRFFAQNRTKPNLGFVRTFRTMILRLHFCPKISLSRSDKLVIPEKLHIDALVEKPCTTLFTSNDVNLMVIHQEKASEEERSTIRDFLPIFMKHTFQNLKCLVLESVFIDRTFLESIKKSHLEQLHMNYCVFHRGNMDMDDSLSHSGKFEVKNLYITLRDTCANFTLPGKLEGLFFQCTLSALNHSHPQLGECFGIQLNALLCSHLRHV